MGDAELSRVVSRRGQLPVRYFSSWSCSAGRCWTAVRDVVSPPGTDSPGAPPALLAGLSPQYQTEGSGCPYEDSGNYFDYIDVEDDEDYVSDEEGSTPQAVRRGPPVFTDSVEENLIVEKSEFDVKEKKTKRRDEDEE